MSSKKSKTYGCFRKPRGFTLHELIITLAVAAVLLGIAIPSLRDMVVNSQLTSGTNSLVATLNYARSEAIKRSESISVCLSSNGQVCTLSSWDAGWIVFTDSGVDGVVDGADQILRMDRGFSDVGVSVTGPPFIQFQPTGGLVDDCGPGCLEDQEILLATHKGPPAWAQALWRWLPIADAVADLPGDGGTGQGQSQGQGNGQGQGQGQGNSGQENENPGPPPIIANFNVCNGSVGRTVSVSAVGRVSVVDNACAP